MALGSINMDRLVAQTCVLSSINIKRASELSTGAISINISPLSTNLETELQISGLVHRLAAGLANSRYLDTSVAV